jgi:2-polyprenyl-6-methoxyphenol hydroxylase-like FAD-dependent oxidoreductase
MNQNFDVLIVGAGPTGLMMACQLLRSNVKFRIIDKNSSPAHESRALVIHPKSMELFQNLGISEVFQKAAKRSIGVQVVVHDKVKVDLDFRNIGIETTPFPSIYFLSQAETERILTEHLEKHGVAVERGIELASFQQTSEGIAGQVFESAHLEYSDFRCHFLVGCDGAHSKVRHILGLPFEGAPYEQEFLLADLELKWPFAHDKLSLFLGSKGIMAHFPLTDQISRLIISANKRKSEEQPTLPEIQDAIQDFVSVPFQVSNPVWLSRFHLHHRIVPTYQKGHAFLAGDAAHIHSPVGGQGMNTGLQDAANLAWKLILVLKGIAPESLLETYSQEREPVGRKLIHTTDRMFTAVTNSHPWIIHLRDWFFPQAMKMILSSAQARKRAFHFVSQLAIHYHENMFIKDTENSGSDHHWAGKRAPFAETAQGSLFELMKGAKFQILLFNNPDGNGSELQDIGLLYRGLVQIHSFQENNQNAELFKRYSIQGPAVFLVRPDGYIAFHSKGPGLSKLKEFLQNIFSFIPQHVQMLPDEIVL